MEGDGDCFYSSVLNVVNNSSLYVKDLRESIANFIYYNWIDLECYIADCEKNDGRDSFVESIKNKRWADHMEILAFSLLYKREVHILRADGCLNIINGANIADDSPIKIYYNGIDHYDSLVKDSKKRKKK